ncbi:hypothetical protein DMN91_001406 [Ooceraea biroi]|uniref:Uncharacterized protein n=1 Tax=Ooceraea biroi TaxID=2015173 RepID=A0A3L8E529_OOCBI|nr:uncharacterized protein LOC105283456 [Ooceraea biroi]RLU27602.1 hypothetical protein DMN91_001406 [Ooceraea biroi]
MIGTKLFVYNIIIWLISSKLLIRVEGKLNNSQTGFNETISLKILPGIKFSLTDGEIIANVRMFDLLQETEIEARKNKEKTLLFFLGENPLQRFGFMMMMTPFVMQILSLPGAIATIKMSLLRSLMVAQLAIAIMIYNFIKSTQTEEVVVIRQPQHHMHYYHNYHYPHDDEDEWFGR